MTAERGGRDDEPVSLHGLDPLAALRALLAVDPDSEPVEDEGGGDGDETSAGAASD